MMQPNARSVLMLAALLAMHSETFSPGEASVQPVGGQQAPGIATPSPVNDYESGILQERARRDALFADPIRSPLATVKLVLIDRDSLSFGSAEADLRWDAQGIAPLHAQFLRRGESIFIRPEEGNLFSHPEGVGVTETTEWEFQRYLRAGPVLLVLQLHPVGPVVRLIDPKSKELDLFQGLHYFPVDPGFRVKAAISRNPAPLKVTILDTQGWERPAWIYGKAEFELEGKRLELDLNLFEEDPSPQSNFLVMFRDLTSGKSTYPACRYLSVPFQETGEFWLDFNRASNPQCAYGDGFACPLPRPGNQLAVEIRAGEKTYSRHP